MNYLKALIITGILAFGNILSFAQTQEEIAQKLQNPLSNITALPIQYNFGLGTPDYEGTTYTTSFQPVMAFDYGNFSMVHRAVIGTSYLPSTTLGNGSTFGTTDLNYSFYFAPKKKLGNLAFGVGPSIDMPTASDPLLGSGKWNAGASIVAVYQKNKWTLDMVFRQTNSFAGDDERADVNRFVSQTLVAYSLGKGWVVNTFPTITANWNADKGQQWTVPVGGGVSKLVFLGKLPTQFGVQYYNNVVRPDYVGKSELRFTTTFVFSK
nr:hypothetical protein [uncultured Carboxylicivirga sp.]